MKNYSIFTVDEFVLDESFQNWVLRPDSETDAFWREWIQANPSKKKDIDEARAVLQQIRFSEYSMSGEEIALLWLRIKNQAPARAAKSSNSRRWIYPVAASLLLAATLLFVFRWMDQETMVHYYTAYGETKTILLPDSSTVILNSNSTLRFPAAWDREPVRKIWLDGEAFFSIKHTVDHQPFHVNVDDGLTVEVLGTTFNVYHRVKETKVVLNTGKIKLHMPPDVAAENIEMKPGDFIEYKEKTYSKRTVDPSIYSAWTQRKLILNHTSLREMVELLQNNYGVDVFVFPDSLLSQTVSGSMPLADAESMVNQIASIFQLKVVKDNNRFLIQE